MSSQDPTDRLDDSQTPPPEDGDTDSEQEEIGQPKRRTINSNTLLLFGLLAVVGAGTYLMCMRAGAQIAEADPAITAANTAIDAFLKGGAQDQHQMGAILRDTEKIVQQFNNYPSARQIPLGDVKNNPFRIGTEARPSAPLAEEIAKQKEREAMDAARQIAGTLKLQSIVYGGRSVCMINGKPYGEGQGTADFTVEKILSQGVWVRIGPVRLELVMPPPQLD
jgi:hypothetical protein